MDILTILSLPTNKYSITFYLLRSFNIFLSTDLSFTVNQISCTFWSIAPLVFYGFNTIVSGI